MWRICRVTAKVFARVNLYMLVWQNHARYQTKSLACPICVFINSMENAWNLKLEKQSFQEVSYLYVTQWPNMSELYTCPTYLCMGLLSFFVFVFFVFCLQLIKGKFKTVVVNQEIKNKTIVAMVVQKVNYVIQHEWSRHVSFCGDIYLSQHGSSIL